MKYKSPRTVWACLTCGVACNVLHEVVFGSLNRQISVDNSIQVPLCTTCHARAHSEKRKYQETYLKWLGLDYWTTTRAFNDPKLREYLEMNREDCEKKIKSLEI
jgi:hypothetical protein